MFKLFWADVKQSKKPFLFMVLSIPLLHYLDSFLFRYALPTTLSIKVDDGVRLINDPLAASSGWLFAIMASIILVLLSEESGGGIQSRLPSLVSLPLSRWKIGLLRHLPALVIIPVLGLILNLYRMILSFFFAISKGDLWQQSRTIDFKSIVDSFWWAFHKVTYIVGAGHASILFQLVGWASMSLLILGIPLLIDDLWPNIKRSSFSLWLSVSLFIGLTLQVGVLAFGKLFELALFPLIAWPSSFPLQYNPWAPSLMEIELLLAIGVMGLELWRFQRRSCYF